MPTPGIYCINSTGESVPLLLEDGTGDTQLLEEMLEEDGYHLIDEEEVISPARKLAGKLLANAGLATICGGVWVTFGLGAGLAATGIYLLLLGYAHQQDTSGGQDA